jgi:hypothetical protein
VLIGLAATIIVSPIALWLAESSDTAYKIVYLAFSIAILLGCIMWVHIDAAQKGIKIGHGFRLAMILVMVIAPPYYFYKSRGTKRGTTTLLKAIGFYLAAVVVSAILATILEIIADAVRSG